MYRLGNRSQRALIGVHPVLAFAVTRAIQITEQDFMVFEGLRTEARQRMYVDKGVSWTMKSNHLTGNAVDLVAYNGKADWSNIDDYKKIAEAMKKVIEHYNLPIEHGYDLWGKDWPHWQMKSNSYNAKELMPELFNLI